MGFLGLFIGPVLMALLVSIWREWIREVKMAEVTEAETVEMPKGPATSPELPPDLPVVRKVSSP
jgi:hypothetical protein